MKTFLIFVAFIAAGIALGTLLPLIIYHGGNWLVTKPWWYGNVLVGAAGGFYVFSGYVVMKAQSSIYEALDY